MIRQAILTAAAALGMAAAVVPADARPRSRSDARLRVVDYDPGRVVRLEGVPRIATEVAFAPGETVEHVALGDSGAWDVAADRNLLFLKPKAKTAATNLIVTTRNGAADRSYVFELVPRSAARRGGAYVLRFRYPADDRARLRAGLDAAEAALETRIAGLKLDRGALEGPRNLAYSVQGPAALQPSEVTDNGRFTVLRFPGAQALPAVYTVGAGGTEALATFDVRGDFVVVHGVAQGLRLRSGHAVLCITNDAWRPTAAPMGRTAAADVARTDLGAKP